MAATTTVPSASPIPGSRSFLSRLREGDEIARLVTFLFAASTVLITLLLILELWQDSTLARHKFGLQFFFTRVWDPIAEQFGVSHGNSFLADGRATGDRRGNFSG
jgi:ABC-type phosphate transport system permease subunit